MARVLIFVALGVVLASTAAFAQAATSSHPASAQGSVSQPAAPCATVAACNLEIQKLSARQEALNGTVSGLRDDNAKMSASLRELQAGHADLVGKYNDLHTLAESLRSLVYTLCLVFVGIQLFLGVLRTWSRRA